MLVHLIHHYFPESALANLFRYITFRSMVAAFASFLFVVFMMPLLIKGLKAMSIRQVVRDDGPKTHYAKAGTPTMGGIFMVLGILLTSFFLCRWDVIVVWIAVIVLLGFGAVGFLDDYLKLVKKNSKGVSFRMKMISLGLISLVAVYLCFHFQVITPKISFPFFKSVALNVGPWFYLWGFLVINGSANAVNLTDGLDGLAIVPIMTTAMVLLITSYISGHVVFANYLQFEHLQGAGELSVIMASLIGVGMGFLWYNSHPAQIFMGDVGSLALGGLLGIVALLTHKEIVLLIAGFLFVMEALSVMIQVGSYKSTRKRVFKMAPLHHHFELSGWPESKIIVRFWILSILFAIIALTTLKLR